MPFPRPSLVSLSSTVLVLAACGSSEPEVINPEVDCSTTTPVTLSPGESVIVDATINAGCIRIPAPGSGGAYHVLVAYAASGTETSSGVSGSYVLSSQNVATAAPPVLAGVQHREFSPSMPARFHANLREREAELSEDPSLPRLVPRPHATAPVPPALGSQRTFKVCGNVNCTSFVDVASTAAYVGPRGAIYLDNTVPSGGLTQEDIDSLGSLFDGASPSIYEIDTMAFGRESDLDSNGVVVVLLTDAVNALSGTCPNGEIILGYFFGADLRPVANSNGGEVFYSLVPNPTGPTCAAPRSFVLRNLPPVLVHELQHMISFNQHVLLRGGASEQTWLNEGLSHFAEELAGRRLPDSRCPLASSCLEDFSIGNLFNAERYLGSVEFFYLVSPGSSFGDLAERGASWLFLRWLADHEAADTLLGTDLTRALVMTSQVGAANVVAVTGQTFSDLVGQWQMANYTESIAGFTDASGRLRYRTWNFVPEFGIYPLAPDTISAGTYTRSGVLRAGSGRHVLVQQGVNAAAIELQLKGDGSFGSLLPRLAIVRIQ